MVARRRRKSGKVRYTVDEKRRYWDQKTLENPDKIPSDYDYGVPKVPEPQPDPYPSEFGLSHSVAQILTYYRDKNAEQPHCFKSRIKENLGNLAYTVFGTLSLLGLLALSANSASVSNKLEEFLAISTMGIGGINCIVQVCALIGTPIRARLARSQFAQLSTTSGPSKLLDGKTLIEAQLAFDAWQHATEARRSEHAQKCEERKVEICRRHRLRLEKLMAEKELERRLAQERARLEQIEYANMMANRELQRLKLEEITKAEKYEHENFHRVAMNLEYWTAGSTSEKGLNLEKKFSILLKRLGFTVKFTPQSGDNGIDIIAEKNGSTVAVQCKNYADKVGASEIREFAGSLKFFRESHPNSAGWLVAPNGFSESTFEKFHRPGDVELLDFNDIRRLVEKP